MKPGVHPEYHEINVIMTDGSTFKTRSTYGKPGETLRLDIDPKTHPAWTGVRQSIDRGGRVQRFKNRFGMIGDAGVGAGAKASAAPAKTDGKK